MKEITISQSNHLKVLAVFFMLGLHLFNRDYIGNYDAILFCRDQPVIFYISYFFDICVPIFAFVSGYGLYNKYTKSSVNYSKDSYGRLKKFYYNLWIVIAIFPVIIGSVFHIKGFPGSMIDVFFNATAIKMSYSPIWWYFTTYVLVVVSTPILFYCVKKYPSIVVLTISFSIYCVSYYFKLYKTNIFTNDLLKWLHYQAAQFGLVQFEFLLGSAALKHLWNTRITIFIENLCCKNLWMVLLLLFLVGTRIFIPSLFVSPFYALAFILIFNQIDLTNFIVRIGTFFTPHVTNIWLVHSFFYMTFFKNFIDEAKYPLFIFLLLLFCSLASSYVVNLIYKKIVK